MLVLVTLLIVVIFYALGDLRRRRGRNEWDHTIEVAVVLLESSPVDPKAIAAFRARVPALEKRLGEEGARHRPGLTGAFTFRVTGPVITTLAPPTARGSGIGDLAAQAYAMRQYTSAVDEAAGLDPNAYDSRIYVTIRTPGNTERTWVEGESEQGGRLGQVTVDLDESMADVALAVVAHETFHTLGATDKYDSSGHTTIPDGLADPARSPVFPQVRADIMARGRVIAPGTEKLLESLEELGVGPATAAEIGWHP